MAYEKGRKFSLAENRNELGGDLSDDENDDYEFDHLVKLIIIGNSAVGKTCICVRFSRADFPKNYISTLGKKFPPPPHIP